MASTLYSAILIVLVSAVVGCAPQDRLSFPLSPALRLPNEAHYDVNGNGIIDFALLDLDAAPDITLVYDDDEDGVFDRLYRTIEYESVPHLIILLDSIPYASVAAYHERGGFAFFPAPVKVIPPFPSMSGLVFSRLLDMPPLSGMINRYYDRREKCMQNGIIGRITGDVNPWHERLHYRAKYTENGLMFLQPREWYPAELVRVRDALDESGDQITIAYIASTSGILSKYGNDGIDDVLAQLEALCLQVLHDRNGAVRISLLSDHGHNLVPAQRVSLENAVEQAGFRIAHRVEDVEDVVQDQDGLVNYMGLHTKQPARLAIALVAEEEVEFAMYLERDEVVVRSAAGSAMIAYRNGDFRYRPDSADVLEYLPLLEQFRALDRMDSDGFVADADWFAATVNHEWPDAPRRLWDAFHGLSVNTPDVMITYRDGACTGLGSLDLFVEMASTHGGLDQQDSVAFGMSTTGRLRGPIRTGDVLRIVEPRYNRWHRPFD